MPRRWRREPGKFSSTKQLNLLTGEPDAREPTVEETRKFLKHFLAHLLKMRMEAETETRGKENPFEPILNEQIEKIRRELAALEPNAGDVILRMIEKSPNLLTIEEIADDARLDQKRTTEILKEMHSRGLVKFLRRHRDNLIVIKSIRVKKPNERTNH